MKPFPTDGMDRCKVCGKYYQPDCDWRQGRCPHHPAHWERFYNFYQQINKFFKEKMK